MRIEPYHRDLVPLGTDNSNFGEICETVSLVNRKMNSNIFVHSEIEGPLNYPSSRVFGKEDDFFKDVFDECCAYVKMAASDPVQTTLFMPDHAALLGSGSNACLLVESTWHSEIFFYDWFRCDRTTGWQFRVDRAFAPQIIGGLVANAYHRYYYQYFHWLFDSLSRAWYIKRFLSRRDMKDTQWYLGNLQSQFQIDCLDLLDINPGMLLKSNLDGVVCFSEAVNCGFEFTESIGTLRPAFTTGVYNVGWIPEYLKEIRDRALAKTKSMPDLGLGEKIFITRPDATHRRIVNQQEVSKLLARYGFIEFCPGLHSLHEQICAFKKARIILGTHGAGMANIIWADQYTKVAELMPAGLHDVGYRFAANTRGQLHHVLICKRLWHDLGTAYADIEVDVGALDDMLKELLR